MILVDFQTPLTNGIQSDLDYSFVVNLYPHHPSPPSPKMLPFDLDLNLPPPAEIAWSLLQAKEMREAMAVARVLRELVSIKGANLLPVNVVGGDDSGDANKPNSSSWNSTDGWIGGWATLIH